MRTSMRVRLGLGVSLAAFLGARGAAATTVLELGDNGSEQMARGGAWVARASDPLAAFYNPAGLAGQETRAHPAGEHQHPEHLLHPPEGGERRDPARRQPGATNCDHRPRRAFPPVCNNAYSPTATNALVPQFGFTYRVTRASGSGSWQPAPHVAARSEPVAGKLGQCDVDRGSFPQHQRPEFHVGSRRVSRERISLAARTIVPDVPWSSTATCTRRRFESVSVLTSMWIVAPCGPSSWAAVSGHVSPA